MAFTKKAQPDECLPAKQHQEMSLFHDGASRATLSGQLREKKGGQRDEDEDGDGEGWREGEERNVT